MTFSSCGPECHCHFDRDVSLLQAQVTAENSAANKLNGGGAFTVRMEAPANLWGKWQCLAFRATSGDAVCFDKCKWFASVSTSGKMQDYV